MMRLLCCCWLLVLGGVLVAALGRPAWAQEEDAALFFEQGNTAYQAGDYAEALLRYEQARTSGYVSGALYHNMGNAYFRLDSLGQAIRYYEKAQRYLPDNVQLQHNVQIARARTVDEFAQLPEPLWQRWWQRIAAQVGAAGLFAAGLVLYLIGAVLVAERIWTGRQTPWRRRVQAVVLALALVVLAGAFYASVSRTATGRVVVLADAVALRAAPEDAAETTLMLHEGTVLDVVQVTPPWYEVRLPNGTSGWVAIQATGDI